MVLGCGAKTLKYCLFAFNLVFFIAGITCLGIGIYLIANKHAFDKVVNAAEEQGYTSDNKPAVVYYLGVMMTVGGAIILIIAFLGCCGAVKEWRPMLVLYAICLMVILAVEIAIAIFAGINRNNIDTVAKKTMIETLKYYSGTHVNKKAVRTAWDAIMSEHQCCGINSTTENEFVKSEWFQKNFSARYSGFDQKDYYPAECCAHENWITIKNAGTQDDPVCKSRRPTGCYVKILDGLESRLAVVIGVGIAVALIQLVGIIFSLCLCRAISEESVG